MIVEQEIDVFGIIAQLAGGLALLLFGTARMGDAVKRALGDRVRETLSSAASTPLRGFAAGAIAAGAMQSSTGVVLLLLAFVGSGALALPPALAVLLGAQLGSTLVNQLVAFRLARFALALLAAGFFTLRSARTESS